MGALEIMMDMMMLTMRVICMHFDLQQVKLKFKFLFYGHEVNNVTITTGGTTYQLAIATVACAGV